MNYIDIELYNELHILYYNEKTFFFIKMYKISF